jgi:hypothetical protein
MQPAEVDFQRRKKLEALTGISDHSNAVLVAAEKFLNQQRNAWKLTLHFLDSLNQLHRSVNV